MRLRRLTAGVAFLLVAHGTRALPITGVRTLDAPDWEQPIAMVPMPDGGRLLLSQRRSMECTLRREDAAGGALWIRHMDDGGDAGVVPALAAARDGGAWLAVSRQFTAPTIVRIAPDGSLAWVKGAPEGTRNAIEAFVHELSDGSAIVAMARGYVSEPTWVARVSAAGDVLWQRDFNGLPGQRVVNSSALLAGDRVLLVGGASSSRLGRLRAWALVLDRDGAVVADLTCAGISFAPPIWGKPLPLADGGALIVNGPDVYRLTSDLRIEPVARVHVGDTPADLDDGLSSGTAFSLPSGRFLLAGQRTLDTLGAVPGVIEYDTAFVEMDADFAPLEAVTIGGSEYDQPEGPVETAGFVRADGTVEVYAQNGGRGTGRARLYALGGPHVAGTECPPRAVIAAWTQPFEQEFEAAGTTVVNGTFVLEPTSVAWTEGAMGSTTECAAVRVADASYDLDVKPGSCPNSLNLRQRGVIPAALVAASPDATSAVDPATVQLEGVPALRCTVADASAPWDEAASNACCGTPAADGEPDLVCHFDSQRVAAALCARHAVPPGAFASVELVLTANTHDGRAIRVTDCARLTAFGCVSRALPIAPRPGSGPVQRLGAAGPH